MKKIILASLITIGLVASASAVDVKPYVGFFPIYYTFYTISSGGVDEDYTDLKLGFRQVILVGIKVSDFRADFSVNSGINPGFNVYYDFNISDSLLPYLNLGIGYSRNTSDSPTYKIEDKYPYFAIGGGIGYKVVSNFILDAGIEYNVYKSDIKIKDKGTDVTSTAKSTNRGCTVKLGGRVEF